MCASASMHTPYASVSSPEKEALQEGSAVHAPFAFGPGRLSPMGLGLAGKGRHLEAMRFRSRVSYLTPGSWSMTQSRRLFVLSGLLVAVRKSLSKDKSPSVELTVEPGQDCVLKTLVKLTITEKVCRPKSA